jgi:hypothetical protein
MARPKGSKNKPVEAKIEELISQVQKLPVDETEKAEAVEELEDLLGKSEVTIEVKEPEIVAQIKSKKFLGRHPITKEEIWE